MAREDVVRALQAHAEELRQRYGVRSLALFGSVSRGQAGPDSDVDLLVEFIGRPSARDFFAMKAHLEDLLGCDVDLATPKMLGPRLTQAIEAELLRVA